LCGDVINCGENHASSHYCYADGRVCFWKRFVAKLLFLSSVNVCLPYTLHVYGVQVMPGLLLCFVLRYDAYKRSQPTSDVGVPAPPSVYQKLTYFHCSLIGYFLGKLQWLPIVGESCLIYRWNGKFMP